MSYWTHITACLSVETFEEDAHLISNVKKYLKHAPAITGSEENAEVFVNKKRGYNCWVTPDCRVCKYRDSVQLHNITDDEYLLCDAEPGYKCPSGKYQTCFVISLQGDLRDRKPEQTQQEFNLFLEYIKKEYNIRDYSVNIEGE